MSDVDGVADVGVADVGGGMDSAGATAAQFGNSAPSADIEAWNRTLDDARQAAQSTGREADPPTRFAQVAGSPPVATASSDVARSGFDLRYDTQDRTSVLEQARKSIEGLVPVVQGLRSQSTLSAEDALNLRSAQGELQQQMNKYALASDQVGDLRKSGLLPSDGFEVNLRAAEAYRKGADDLAQTPGAPGELTPFDAAQRLRSLSPDHAGALLDGAISVSGIRHLDTTGLMSEGERSNALKNLGAGYTRAVADIDHSLTGQKSFLDQFRAAWDRDALERQSAPLKAQALVGIIDEGASRGLSQADRSSLQWGTYAETGRQNWGNVLGDLTAGAAGTVLFRENPGALVNQLSRFTSREAVIPRDPFPTVTRPSTSGPGRVFGTPEANRPGVDADVKFGIEKQNESLARAARQGYDVTYQPTATLGADGRPLLNAQQQAALGLKAGKDPDALINGRVFDVYAPLTADVKGVYSGMADKVSQGQAHRLIVNLEGTTVTPQQLRDYLMANPIANLKEVKVDYQGRLINLFPFLN
jgi:hypothetical protein